jgi:deoxyadenosine/deoxycytidine kinase
VKLRIGLEGVPFSGKSKLGDILTSTSVYRLTRGLPEGIQVRFFSEKVDENPVKQKAYDTGMQESYAHVSQEIFSSLRLKTEVEASRFLGISFEDRTRLGDWSIAKNLVLLKKIRQEVYEAIIRHGKENMELHRITHPHGIVLLKITTPTLLKRLIERETGEPLDEAYFDALNRLYPQEIEAQAKKHGIPVLPIDANSDFKRNPHYVDKVADEVNAFIKMILKRSEEIPGNGRGPVLSTRMGSGWESSVVGG